MVQYLCIWSLVRLDFELNYLQGDDSQLELNKTVDYEYVQNQV